MFTSTNTKEGSRFLLPRPETATASHHNLAALLAISRRAWPRFIRTRLFPLPDYYVSSRGITRDTLRITIKSSIPQGGRRAAAKCVPVMIRTCEMPKDYASGVSRAMPHKPKGQRKARNRWTRSCSRKCERLKNNAGLVGSAGNVSIFQF